MARSIESTRQAFLEEGQALLFEVGVGRGLRMVPVAEVARRLGRTTGAAYQIWERQDDYHHELVSHILKDAEWTDAELLLGMFAKQHDHSTDIDEQLRIAPQNFLTASIQRPSSLIWLYFFAVSEHDPAVRDHLANAYLRFQSAFGKAGEQLLPQLKRRLLPPYTIDDLATSLIALTEGFRQRISAQPEANRTVQRADRPPGAPSWTLFAVSFEAVLDAYTEPLDD